LVTSISARGPAVKGFLDEVFVPALVRKFLAEPQYQPAVTRGDMPQCEPKFSFAREDSRSPMIRCAVYARFSSEKQSPLSISDQVRKCREYAERHGWSVLDSYIYSDEAISGATDDRFGLRRMLAATTGKDKPFDALLRRRHTPIEPQDC